MKFSPLRAKQNLTALHPLSESCWDSQTSPHDESTDITGGEELFRNPAVVSHGSSMSGGFREGGDEGGGESFTAASEQVISYCSKPPRACCT